MDELKQAILSASTHPGLRDAVESLYAHLARDIARRQPRCDASGRCCHFDDYGHRLYITTAELATFLHAFHHHTPDPAATAPPPPTRLPILNPQSLPPACPLQVDGLCSVHAIRPFGCRIFFCDPTADAWQRERYEHYHAQLKHLHTRFSIPYYYVEWRTALRALGPLR